MTIINYVVKSIFISSVCGLMGELTCQWPVGTFKNFGVNMAGILVSGPRCGKWILEMIGAFEMLVHVNVTEFLRHLLISGEIDIGPIGQ
jgi:hypothetical protein